ncbi:MAG: tRNA lysidine(34) synthetase TilS [Bacilli bacterium]|nr:tRNA lysidine(34) synthetase TilS [Bacilli bacterium]
MKDAIKYLENKLEEKDVVVLGLSGGPDSMCLLSILKKINKKVQIICAHVNHHTRKENKQEYEFIKNYLEKEEIPLEYYEIPAYKNQRFTEAEAREKRYQFFKEVYQKHHAKYLLTAHHALDLAETIVMRMIRGSSLLGYAGILQESQMDEMNLLRPFLSVSKKEIYEYLEQNQIPYVTDSSNDSSAYLRNRIRKQLLPILEEVENYPQKIQKFSKTLQEANQVLEEEIRKSYPSVVKNNKIVREEFSKFSRKMQLLLLKKYFHEQYQNRINLIQDKHINKCRELLIKKQPVSMDIPLKKSFILTRKYAYISDKQEKKTYQIKLDNEVRLPNGGIVKKISESQKKSNYEIHLNSKELALPLYLTTRKPGMRMEIKNLNGSRKVNDILIDKKIENQEKDEIPILIDSNQTVLWILGVSKSKYDVINEEKYDIIYKYEKKKEV